ncbi:uncharacterized protein LOC108148671 [Drosophila elegans]|uniref:uncharacterized protein LOC108148671 n=1 Tax=Drosophila elegans TaxID=30023 RepID=UPI0007E5EE4F|nr:uncharacterized protein LOC108148671 [Drosophila elegans]
MFRSLSVLMFNTSEIEANLFGMADDVYNTIEIFKEAATFETKIARPYKLVSNIMDCLVFMAVALMVVAFIMHDRIVVFRKLAKINLERSERKRIPHPRKVSSTSLVENDIENAKEPAEDDGVGNGTETDDADTITIQPSDHAQIKEKTMVGTPKWAFNWLSTIKNKGFGTIYDGFFPVANKTTSPIR